MRSMVEAVLTWWWRVHDWIVWDLGCRMEGGAFMKARRVCFRHHCRYLAIVGLESFPLLIVTVLVLVRA